MYAYDFTPSLKGLNPEEVFVVMPFAPSYDRVYTDLVEPAVASAAASLGRTLRPYRTKGDLRTTSGWVEVLEHLYTAQIVLGVLTDEVNANVQYELGIAHATQPIRRQVLIAEENYKPVFDTKDLIFMRYSASSLGGCVAELTDRIQTALREWEVEQEVLVHDAIAKITPFEFEIIMQWGLAAHFAIGTSGSGPANYELSVARVHGQDKAYMHDVFRRHCDAVGRLQHSGLLGLSTKADPPSISFSYYWTDLGNLVLLKFQMITQAEREHRYKAMPRHLRRVS
jgi:hypothetical protein